MIRTILKYPDERLRQISAPVEAITEATRELVQDMIETMVDANGIGLAAPQIGEFQRIVVIARSVIEDIERNEEQETERPLECLVLINPRIELQGEKILYQEGCLSVPEYREQVERYSEVILHAHDELGAEYTLHAKGLLAVCIQHELDHLEGKLFIDRLSFLKRSLYEKKMAKRAMSSL